MPKKKYNWNKDELRALKLTRRIWQKIWKRVEAGENMRFYLGEPVWVKNSAPVITIDCPLCELGSCSHCPYTSAFYCLCHNTGEPYIEFYNKPTKTNLKAVLKKIDELLS